VTSFGVKTRDLLSVGEPTTMVMILEVEAPDAPGCPVDLGAELALLALGVAVTEALNDFSPAA